MTTEYTRLQPARLPANHPLHVEQVLTREEAWRKTRNRNRLWRAFVSLAAISILILCAVVALR